MRREAITFFLGMLIAAIMLPASVMAAASLIRIQGPSGNVAQVDGAKQLLVVEANPADFVTKQANVSGNANCVVVDSQPSTRALIVSQIRIFVGSGADGTKILGIFPNKTCTGTIMYTYVPLELGTHTETFEPGYPIKAGAGVSAVWFGPGTATVTVNGYGVPDTAVP